jgi:hypothetical protein
MRKPSLIPKKYTVFILKQGDRIIGHFRNLRETKMARDALERGVLPEHGVFSIDSTKWEVIPSKWKRSMLDRTKKKRRYRKMNNVTRIRIKFNRKDYE